MKKLINLFCILIFCLAFLSCEKRPFATIEVKGRVLNFWSKSPITSSIALWVGSSTPGSKGTTNYGSYSTNSDGSFDIKSNAQWNGNNYTLVFVPSSSSGDAFNEKYAVSKNQTLDIGDILVGHLSIICKVTLNSVSGASIKFTKIGSTPQTTFNAGTHAVITASSYYDSYSIQTVGNFYPISYRLSTSAADSNIRVPLHPPTDTTSVTINY